MRLVVRVKLLPTPEQAAALETTLHTVNQAANQVSRVAFERKIFRGYDLRKITYGQVRDEFALGHRPPSMRSKKSSTPIRQ